MQFRKITIIGVGLLGGSLGLAARKRRLAREVAGYVRRHSSIAECQRAGVVHRATLDLNGAVRDADLIILCTPLSQMRLLMERMRPALKCGAIVTDVGSVKASVVRELESAAAKAGAHFIGSHPMAGAEKMGVAASRENLFENSVCVVTPTKRTNAAALRAIKRFWKSLGARVLRLSPEEHDEMVSRTSHLPHFIAAALANFILDPSRPKVQVQLCANGFRDTTRIASGSPRMWRDIAVANRAHLRVALDEFVRELQELQALLRGGKLVPHVRMREAEAAKLEKLLATAKQRRDNWCSRCASPSPE